MTTVSVGTTENSGDPVQSQLHKCPLDLPNANEERNSVIAGVLLWIVLGPNLLLIQPAVRLNISLMLPNHGDLAQAIVIRR